MRRARPLLLALLLGAVPASAQAATTQQQLRFTASDGVQLAVTVSGQAPLAGRPAVIEMSPYGRGGISYAPPATYNTVLVQTRGTGDSDGRFDALGPRTQRDLAEITDWACRQPWTNGHLALSGFSASAITIYNSLHRPLRCVDAMILRSGTHELYRDLLVPGAINNLVPGAGVVALIGAPALQQGPDRLQRAPATGIDTAGGLLTAGLTELQHPTLDSWWQQRGFRGNVNHVPALVLNSFFDVESRGAFQGFQALKADGAHLYVQAAHDGTPAGTDGGKAESDAWLDHHLRGIDNGVDRHPRVQVWMADGRREDYLAGRYVSASGDDWPLPGTTWTALAFDSTRSGAALSSNDGSLRLGRPAATVTQPLVTAPSLFTGTDVPNAAIAGGAGLNQLTNAFPILSQGTIPGALGLTYTSAPLRQDVVSAGPGSVELRVASTAPESGIWVVLSDVDPQGNAHPLTTGRLSTAFPNVDLGRSLVVGGEVVQPYNGFAARKSAPLGAERLYRVELWPVGNRFKAGHRIRVDIVGQSIASLPGVPAVNAVRVGGGQGARLLLPVLAGSDLRAALGG